MRISALVITAILWMGSLEAFAQTQTEPSLQDGIAALQKQITTPVPSIPPAASNATSPSLQVVQPSEPKTILPWTLLGTNLRVPLGKLHSVKRR